MRIIDHSAAELAAYTARQINNLLPTKDAVKPAEIERHLPDVLDRLRICVNRVRWWRRDEFDPLHSSQYCIYLYFLANTIWRASGETRLPTKLFGLNKALNGIDLFYEIAMPDIFFIGHSVGIVLAKATYADFMVLYQNSTVGKNHGEAPILEQGVVMYPNTAVIGRCRVGANTVIAQGTSIVNRDTPGDCYAFSGEGGALVFKPAKRDVLADIFRL